MRRSVAGLVIAAGLWAAGQSAGWAVLEVSPGAARALPDASNMAAKSARRTIILTLPAYSVNVLIAVRRMRKHQNQAGLSDFANRSG
jgi:hypothetical protein